MKRAVIAGVIPLVLGAGMLVGCDSSSEGTVVTYNPRIDGLTPPAPVTPDLSILENQKDLYNKQAASVKGVAPAAAPAAPAPVQPGTAATAPSGTNGEGAGAPPAPARTAPPPAPPPG